MQQPSRRLGRRRLSVWVGILGLGSALLAAGCAGSNGSGAGTATPRLERSVTDVVQFRARVRAIDIDMRRFTMVDAVGGLRSYYADESVRNFDRIAVGDEVVGTLIGSLAIEVRAPEPGETPADLERVRVGDTVVATFTESLQLEAREPCSP